MRGAYLKQQIADRLGGDADRFEELFEDESVFQELQALKYGDGGIRYYRSGADSWYLVKNADGFEAYYQERGGQRYNKTFEHLKDAAHYAVHSSGVLLPIDPPEKPHPAPPALWQRCQAWSGKTLAAGAILVASATAGCLLGGIGGISAVLLVSVLILGLLVLGVGMFFVFLDPIGEALREARHQWALWRKERRDAASVPCDICGFPHRNQINRRGMSDQ